MRGSKRKDILSLGYEQERHRDVCRLVLSRLEGCRKRKETITRVPTAEWDNSDAVSYILSIEETKKLQQMAYELPIYFGRVDILFDETWDEVEQIYIGKLGFQEGIGGEILIHDWRAPISQLYYRRALGRLAYHPPMGDCSVVVTLRRTFDWQDELQIAESQHMPDFYAEAEALDLEPLPAHADDFLRSILNRQTAGYLRDIVRTIAQDQDVVIRHPCKRMLMIGAAGTGKTIVALHRLAFLLYEARERVNSKPTSTDVLLISPSKLFTFYVANVLPDLYESPPRGVTFSELFVDAAEELLQRLPRKGRKVHVELPNLYQSRFLSSSVTAQKVVAAQTKNSLVWIEPVSDFVNRYREQAVERFAEIIVESLQKESPSLVQDMIREFVIRSHNGKDALERTLLLFADFHIFKGRPDDAISILVKCGHIDKAAMLHAQIGNRVEFMEFWGRFFEESGDYVLAVKLYEHIGMHEKSEQCRAKHFEKHGDYGVAAGLYEDLGLYDKAGRCYENHADYANAARCYRKAGMISEMLRCYAMDYMERGEYQLAADNFLKVEWYASAGECYEKLNDLVNAARCYRLAEKKGSAFRCWARVAEGSLKWYKAARYYSKAQDHIKAAECYLRAGRAEEGAEQFVAAGEYTKASQIYDQLGQHDKAQKYRKMACSTSDQNVITSGSNAGYKTEYETLADRAKSEGRYRDAARNYEAAGCYEKAAECYSLIEDYAKAAECYEASKKFEDASACYEKLGVFGEAARCAELAGKFEQARLNYQKEHNNLSVCRCLIKEGKYNEAYTIASGCKFSLSNLSPRATVETISAAASVIHTDVMNERGKLKELEKRLDNLKERLKVLTANTEKVLESKKDELENSRQRLITESEKVKKEIERLEKVWNPLDNLLNQLKKVWNPLHLYTRFWSDDVVRAYLQQKLGGKWTDLQAGIQSSLEQIAASKTLPWEDVAPLIYIAREEFPLTTFRKRIGHPSYVMIDEAQDLSLLHYTCLLPFLPPDAQLIVCGDFNQTVLPTGTSSASDVGDLLQIEHKTVFKYTYRSTAEIMDFAHAILGKKDEVEPIRKSGDLPCVIGFETKNNMDNYLPLLIKEILPCNSLCVVCKSDEQAREVYELLRADIPQTVLLLPENEKQLTGVFVASIGTVKGVEFDAVIVYDTCEGSYSTEVALHKNLLYVACTRALHHLYLLYSGSVSPLIPFDRKKTHIIYPSRPSLHNSASSGDFVDNQHPLGAGNASPSLIAVARAFEKANMLSRAARCYEQTGQLADAARCYEKSNHYASAARCYERTGKVQDVARCWGRLNEQQGKWLEAGQWFEKAVLLPEAAGCYEKALDYTKAAQCYEQAQDYANAARCYEKAKEYAKAVRCYEQVGKVQDVARCWGRLSEQQGKWLEAGQWFEKAVLLPEAAGCYEQAQDYANAARCYEKANDHANGARCYEQAKDYAKAGQCYEQVQDYANGARCYEQAKDYAKAAECYEQAGKEGDTARCWGRFYERQGNWSEAGQWLEKAGLFSEAAQCYEQGQDYANAAQCYERTGQCADAARCYEQAKDYAKAAECYEQGQDYANAAQCYERAGQYADATRRYEQAKDYAKAAECYEQVQDYANGARCYEQAKDYAKAAECYEQAGKEGDAARCWGRFYERQGNWSEAGQWLEKANLIADAARCYEQAQQYAKAAVCYEQAKEYVKAAQCYEQAQDYANAAQCYEQAKDYTKAAQCYEQAQDYANAAGCYEKVNKAADAARCWGRLHEQQGKWLEAGQSFEKAGLFPEAARCYERAKNYANAARCYEQVQDYVKAGQCCEKAGKVKEAGRFYERAGNIRDAARCYQQYAQDLVATLDWHQAVAGAERMLQVKNLSLDDIYLLIALYRRLKAGRSYTVYLNDRTGSAVGLLLGVTIGELLFGLLGVLLGGLLGVAAGMAVGGNSITVTLADPELLAKIEASLAQHGYEVTG